MCSVMKYYLVHTLSLFHISKLQKTGPKKKEKKGGEEEEEKKKKKKKEVTEDENRNFFSSSPRRRQEVKLTDPVLLPLLLLFPPPLLLLLITTLPAGIPFLSTSKTLATTLLILHLLLAQIQSAMPTKIKLPQSAQISAMVFMFCMFCFLSVCLSLSLTKSESIDRHAAAGLGTCSKYLSRYMHS